MLIWIAILSVLIVLSILEFLYLWDGGNFLDVVAVFVVLFSFTFLVGTIVQGINYATKTTEYKNTHGLYLICESNCGIEESETILFTQERNEWINEAKIARETFGAFSLYPKDVLDLELIKK
jgi:hypothetical protein